ncbi:hypothetical protein BJX64DRAFT_255405 [Aspergillus heterothallicus]
MWKRSRLEQRVKSVLVHVKDQHSRSRSRRSWRTQAACLKRLFESLRTGLVLTCPCVRCMARLRG